jgi:nucleotide-binding universal stress UspA family protein
MFQRIVLAVDADDATAVATSFTVGLARSSNASVHVLHVHEYLLGGRGHTVLSQHEAEDLVVGVVGELWAAGIDATASIVRATVQHVAAAVADTALAQGADVIVLGRRRRRWLPRVGRGLRERIADCTGIAVVAAPPPLATGLRVPARTGSVAEVSLGARRTR